MIFETHADYDDDRFKDDRDETIKRVHEKGVAPIINVGIVKIRFFAYKTCIFQY